MLKTITTSLAALLLCYTSLSTAEELVLKADAPKNYTVKEGDTLWDISGMYLSKPWLWPQLWKLNPQVDNPNLIYPGDVLSLSFDDDGNPVLEVNEDANVVKISPDTSAPVAEAEVTASEESTEMSRPEGYKKLSPQQRKTMKSTKAVTTLPLKMIRPFLTYEQALSESDINKLPYVLGANDQVKNSIKEHVLYVRGELELGASYGIYRKGKAYIDPQSEDLLGYETILVATAKVFRPGSKENNEPASVQVIDVKQEIRQGDKLLPAADGQSLPAFFVMKKPEKSIEGVIIDTTSDLREFSKWDIVVLNKGLIDDVAPGHMFSIYRNSPAVVDTKRGPVYLTDASKYEKMTGGIDGEVLQMPKEKIGNLMVFKVSDRVSFAIVTGTRQPIRVGDLIGDI
ncbi:LysM peptidoglycan-binding domain-containing protein [Rheinheimera sp. 4Y26]|uniref:LysM peptidoglycan-binding domain-containing protein n=1 Tax=Rheinheimera sp. 4Y26 TaxID=2977811 RepID=UPI0021B0CBC8|nr:LysM domain-containing protein [Rheinheimera sp. 4Y26]MCT6700492.1 LysM peptidoglycan-binding domain-containing protein [Rheinheimera sp. 4Y26]